MFLWKKYIGQINQGVINSIHFSESTRISRRRELYYSISNSITYEVEDHNLVVYPLNTHLMLVYQNSSTDALKKSLCLLGAVSLRVIANLTFIKDNII